MPKVWAIESGEYSSYCIVGVFSTRENAEQAARDMGAAGGDIVEWELDPGIDALRAGLYAYEVRMLHDGTVEKCDRRWTGSGEAGPRVIQRSKWPTMPKDLCPNYNGPDFIEATVFARDHNHAVKIVNEKRAQILASGQWDEMMLQSR